MIATAGMTFTSKPPDGPERRVWHILSVLLGEVLELCLLPIRHAVLQRAG
jgi:hypothetical protein